MFRSIQVLIGLTSFNPETNLLSPSTAKFEKPPSRLATAILRLFSTFGFVKLTSDPKTGFVTETTNLTILNTFLLVLGDMNEKNLVKTLIGTQVSEYLVYQTFD